MASFHKSLCILLPFFFTLLSSSHAYTFNVGGKDGWTLHPSESYSQWSGRLRFLINDILHFKYNGGSDSVMVVNNGDYDNCNTSNPITALTGGDSSFTLNRSGPFYFISGNKSNCDQGQKLSVVVLSVKRKPPPPVSSPPAPSPGGGASPPASFSPAPIVSPISSSPQSGPSVSTPPASSPGGGASPPASFSPAPVVSPISSSPQSGQSVSTAPGSSPGGGDSSSPVGNPADVNAPPPRGSSAARPAISAISSVSLAMITFGLVWFY